LAGTRAEQGRALLAAADLPNVQSVTSLTEATESAVRAVQENARNDVVAQA